MASLEKPLPSQNFFFETSRYPARENESGALGTLISGTEIKIKGDHTEGPVLVDVNYICRFIFDQSKESDNKEQLEKKFDRVVPRDEWKQETFEIVKKRRWFQ